MSTSVSSGGAILHHTDEAGGPAVNLDQPDRVDEAPLAFLAGRA